MVHRKKKKTNVYKIFSRGMDRQTGKVTYRTEFVDVKKNELFSKYPKNEKVVGKAFESFWNLDSMGEKVIVDSVVKSNIKSRGKNWGIKMLS